MPPEGQTTPDEVTARIRRHWDRQAATYDRSMRQVERFAFGDGRSWVCSRAQGRTLEVAVGSGRNLHLYSADIVLTGIDLSPRMLALARERARELDREIDLREADAERLPFADAGFDTVVSTLSLCSVPSLEATVSEMKRVLRPGGRLLLLDHVRPTFPPLRWVLHAVQWGMNRVDPGNGEQMMRRPLITVEKFGFEVEERERFKGGAVERISARKPDPAP